MSSKSELVKKLVLAVSSFFVLSATFLAFSIVKSNDLHSNKKVIKDDFPQIGDNDNKDTSNGGQENPNNPSEGEIEDKPSNEGQEDNPLGGETENKPSEGGTEDTPDTPSNGGGQENPNNPSEGEIEDKPSNEGQEDNPLGGETENKPSEGGTEDTPSNGGQENPNNPSNNQDSSNTKESFDNLKKLMSNNDYFDTIIKNGEKKSDYLTSSFAWKNPKNKYTPEEQMNKFKELFNIPEIKNINFEIIDVKYSYNDDTLSNTEMKVKAKITNTLTNDSFEKEYKISGFFDPFGKSRLANMKDYEFYNKHDIKNYYSVDPIFRDKEHFYGTRQYSWFSWEPVGMYSSYVTLCKYHHEDLSGALLGNSVFVNWGKLKAGSIANDLNSKDSNYKVTVQNTWFYDGGKYRLKRYGNENSSGTCPAPIGTLFKISSLGLDNKGNSAVQNYKDVLRKTYVWLYFFNGYWGH